jgi:hypothetical protein
MIPIISAEYGFWEDCRHGYAFWYAVSVTLPVRLSGSDSSNRRMALASRADVGRRERGSSPKSEKAAALGFALKKAPGGNLGIVMEARAPYARLCRLLVSLETRGTMEPGAAGSEFSDSGGVRAGVVSLR